MKLSREQVTQDQKEMPEPLPKAAVPNKGRWSTAFLMAGSALLGATAVAFWNRRTIANMRVQFLAEAAKPHSRVNTNEEIF
jgi:hypothetical protein